MQLDLSTLLAKGYVIQDDHGRLWITHAGEQWLRRQQEDKERL